MFIHGLSIMNSVALNHKMRECNFPYFDKCFNNRASSYLA